ncbi:MAG TPA: energy transducer TonB [Bacteroidales bacterium]|nr:energy transducer TonB [Bacteroidales bacterium]
MKKNKIKNTVFSDLLRYERGEMTSTERNSFEKELERDPFLAEAVEGFGSVANTEADIETIGKRLKRRTAGRKLTAYRIAASIAVLMIVSSVFFVFERQKKVNQEALPEYRSVTMDIAMSEPVRKPEEPSQADKPAAVKERISSTMAGKKVEDDITAQNMVPEKLEEIATEDEAAKQIAEPVQEPRMPDSNRFLSEGAEMNQPVAAMKRAVLKNNPAEQYSPPLPAGGQEAFDKYILENIRRPDSATTGQRVVVVTSIRVRKDGSIDSIKIVRSPHKQFSDEAIRLLKEGPAWNPAIRNGSSVDDEITIRIVFP